MLSVQKFVTKNSMCPTLPIHLILPRVTVFVSSAEKVLKGKWFADVQEVKQNPATLKGIKINEFKNCSEQWKKHLNRCIASKGEYFEGD